MKTDHHALVINCADTIPNVSHPSPFCDLRKPTIDALTRALNTLDLSCITDLSDVDLAYDKFLTITTHLINSNIPLRTVTISDNTPTYITPLVKSLLRIRNKQLRRGKTTYAHSLSVKIGKLNAETREKQLSQVSNKDIKKLWSSVRSSTSQRKSASSTLCFKKSSPLGLL